MEVPKSMSATKSKTMQEALFGVGHNQPPDGDDAWQESVASRTRRYIAPENYEGSFVFKCLGCGCLDIGRHNQVTCSGKCRVRWHRNPRRAEIEAIMKSPAVGADIITKAHMDAADELGFGKAILSGELNPYKTALNGRKIESAQPIRAAFWNLVWQQSKKEMP
jgi:hypothetical protein